MSIISKMYLVSSVLLYTFLGSAVAASERVMCVSDTVIPISQEHPRVFIDDGVARRSSISLDMPVDCSTKATLVPRNLETALRYLDIALPIRFKSAMLPGDQLFIYANSNYGSSVVSDVTAFMYRSWKLSDSSDICVDSARELGRDINEATCEMLLLLTLKERLTEKLSK